MEPWPCRIGEDGQSRQQSAGLSKEQEPSTTSSIPMPCPGTAKDQREVPNHRPLLSSRVLDAQGFKLQRQERRRLAMSSSRNLEETIMVSPPSQEAPQRVKDLSRMFQTSQSPIKLPTLPPASSRRSVASTISEATLSPSGESQPATARPQTGSRK